MNTRPDTVTAELELRLAMPGSVSLPVRADIKYDAADPFAVNMTFHTGVAEIVQWTFARQLLTDGISRAVGEGDVQVWPARGGARGDERVVFLSLSSPSGRALFEIPLTDLVEFLSRSYTAVPTGAEAAHLDLDTELALLLWREPGS